MKELQSLRKYFKTISFVMLTSLFLSGCSIWPYKSDFDCKTPEGLKCQSLYNVAKMADSGAFGPEGNITEEEIELINRDTSKRAATKRKSRFTLNKTKRGCCNGC